MDADEAHVDAALDAVPAVREEAIGVTARARRIGVDVLAADADLAQRPQQRDPQIDVVLARPGDDQTRRGAEPSAERGRDLGPDREAARADRRPERLANAASEFFWE